MKCLNEIWPCRNKHCHFHVHAYGLNLNQSKCKETDKSLEIGNCRKRICNEWTLEEIGECLGLTRERVRQIEEKALEKLILGVKVNDFADNNSLKKQLVKRRDGIRLKREEREKKEKIYQEKARIKRRGGVK